MPQNDFHAPPPKKLQAPRSCKINVQLKLPLSHKYTDWELIMLINCVHLWHCLFVFTFYNVSALFNYVDQHKFVLNAIC